MKTKTKKIIIIILSVILLTTLSYTCYKTFFKENNNNTTKEEQNQNNNGNEQNKQELTTPSDKNEETKKEQESPKEETDFEDEERYQIIEEQKNKYMVLLKDDTQYMIVNRKGKWYEIDSRKHSGLAFEVLGIANNILYYITYDGRVISVNLNKKIDTTSSISYGEENKLENLHSSQIVEGHLYIEFLNGEYDNQYSIMDYELKENYMLTGEVEEELNLGEEPATFYINNNKIYYLQDYNDCDKNLNVYNITTKKTTTLKENVCEFLPNNNSLIISNNPTTTGKENYYTINLNNNEEHYITKAEKMIKKENGIYFENSKNIYKYNPSNEKPEKIAEGQIHYQTNKTAIYYLNNNKIYSYDGTKTILLYEEKDKTSIVSYEVFEDKKLIVYTDKNNCYIIDGKKVSKNEFKNSFSSYNVMNEGTGKTTNFKVFKGNYY